ncbi:hypothetical protein O3P69_015859 [Scylla paramamosain]|uniref:DDE Tnp4 domain-containing protein n=1 Tax=Scylla paramamosain TaxID=85552 RepID=A0AAW0T7Y6_SCYPA
MCNSYVWRESQLRKQFTDGRFGDSVLLGDSSFPLEPFLMTPQLNSCSLPEEQMEQNIKHHPLQPPPPPKSPPRHQLQQPINTHYHYLFHVHLHLQRAEALGKEPEPHSTKKLYLSKISGKQLELVKGVYKDLANPALLQKCLSGRTQNPNESLDSKVWRKVSKDKYARLHRTRFVSQMTI